MLVVSQTVRSAHALASESDDVVLGNDYTFAGTMFTAGYVVGQLPSALVLSSGRISPRFWFPFCCAVWGILTLSLACEYQLHIPRYYNII